MAAPSHSKILILDFGAQYTQLIARRLRELNVYCEIHPFDVDDAFIREFAPRGIILSGGPNSVTEGDTPRAPEGVWTAGVPVLGICYGMQAMAAQLGGTVEAGHVREFGYAQVRARNHSALFRDIQDRANADGHGLLDVWMSHGDKVTAHAARVQAYGIVGRLRYRGDGRRVAPVLRRSVPSRGDAHEAGNGDPGALRARDLRLRPRLEHARLRRRGDRRRAARRPAARTSCWDFRAASTRRSPPRSSTARSAIASPACSSTMACCVCTRRSR